MEKNKGMRAKTINAVIQAKFNDFVKSIEDEKVAKLVSDNTIVTGGCIVSMLLGEDINDFDMYFKNKETVLAVANYYCQKFIETHPRSLNEPYVLDGATIGDNEHFKDHPGGAGMNMTPDRVKIIIKSAGVAGDVNDEEDPFVDVIPDITKEEEEPPIARKYTPRYLSCNAISLSDKVQLIIRFYGNAEEIHKNYDFAHCTNYWESSTGKVVLRQEALEAILAKELLYIGSKYPLASVIRTRKFIKRGWHINAGQFLKMCFQVSQLDLKNIAVLEDQLVGVDVAYFQMLIDALQKSAEKAKEEKREFTYEYGYLATIIDKLF